MYYFLCSAYSFIVNLLKFISCFSFNCFSYLDFCNIFVFLFLFVFCCGCFVFAFVLVLLFSISFNYLLVYWTILSAFIFFVIYIYIYIYIYIKFIFIYFLSFWRIPTVAVGSVLVFHHSSRKWDG